MKQHTVNLPVVRLEEGEKMRVVSANGHPAEVRGVESWIRSESGMQYCGNADSDSDFRQLAEQTGAHIGIVDTTMRGKIYELLSYLKSEGMPCIVTDKQPGSVFANAYLKAGASAYRNTAELPNEELIRTIRRAAEGDLENMLPTPALQSQESPIAHLSLRQMQILQMIGDGMTTKKIATVLGITPKTVETHKDQLQVQRPFLTNMRGTLRHTSVWLRQSGTLPDYDAMWRQK